MNKTILTSCATVEEAASLAIDLDKRFVKAFNRAMTIELYAAASFTTKRDSDSKVEVIAKWKKENEAAAKQEIEWLKGQV